MRRLPLHRETHVLSEDSRWREGDECYRSVGDDLSSIENGLSKDMDRRGLDPSGAGYLRQDTWFQKVRMMMEVQRAEAEHQSVAGS